MRKQKFKCKCGKKLPMAICTACGPTAKIAELKTGTEPVTWTLVKRKANHEP